MEGWQLHSALDGDYIWRTRNYNTV